MKQARCALWDKASISIADPGSVFCSLFQPAVTVGEEFGFWKGFLCFKMSFYLFPILRAKSLHSCLTLCDPMDCSLPGSSFHGILLARILELSCPLPGDLPDSGIEPASLMSPALPGRFFTTSTTWEAPIYYFVYLFLAVLGLHCYVCALL